MASGVLLAPTDPSLPAPTDPSLGLLLVALVASLALPKHKPEPGAASDEVQQPVALAA